ncbi:aspartyl-phosphate phosphatase Spo0E family protein [Sutcliffiella horikoshii]|uniref:aspartyl-phosphate phosphatase Spo0E family protein n=1 Tax=Sutcliffiella horikoshii TaxID=79883 RepID=UPI001CC11B8D|nr:aspartyl-phosphate phosphatase Spo0E family protein [Sutcliffiella horikoshii]MCM3619640.1 aspartyl-phosphate phosphatase Spo0E family protein [Sutcliffiella horikoshii]UAL49812.1 aspartyl-phosphate phosphatase Spo0E family protein [Sutcliffiella horikoshii]
MFSKLEDKRLELLNTAKKYGMQNANTLKVSKELDELILLIQKEKSIQRGEEIYA